MWITFLIVLFFSTVGRIWAFLNSFKFALSRHEVIYWRVRIWCAGNGWRVECEPNPMGLLGSQWMYSLKDGTSHAQWVDESTLTIKTNWSDFLEFMDWVKAEGSKPPEVQK